MWAVTSEMPTTAGIPRERATIAVWLVSLPSSVTIPTKPLVREFQGFRWEQFTCGDDGTGRQGRR